MNRSILVVEDSKIDFKVLTRALIDVHCDANVMHYEMADLALDYLLNIVAGESQSDGLPSLIILDLNLPGLSGLEFLRILKEHNNLKQLPVIILSTSDNSQDILSAYTNGAAAYMKKKLAYQDFVIDIQSMCQFWFKTTLLL